MKKITNAFYAITISIAIISSLTACSTYKPMIGTYNTPAKDDFTVLGRIEREFESDEAAFTKLFAAAEKEYPGAEDLVNFFIDERAKGGTKYYIISALVIKYNK